MSQSSKNPPSIYCKMPIASPSFVDNRRSTDFRDSLYSSCLIQTRKYYGTLLQRYADLRLNFKLIKSAAVPQHAPGEHNHYILI